MGGKAKVTNVAAGMSGSPVYIDGKLVGAVALRFSVFSPDAICGITPIELMLEIEDFDKSRPADARTPDKIARASSIDIPGEMLGRYVSAGASNNFPSRVQTMTPIDTPLVLSGFSEATINAFDPMFHQMGITAVQGGAERGRPHRETSRRMGTFAESGRSGLRHSGFRRHVGHRHGHSHL